MLFVVWLHSCLLTCQFVVVFMLLGLIIFGAKHPHGDLNWSFAFAVIGCIFCLAASILAVVQMKQSNVI